MFVKKNVRFCTYAKSCCLAVARPVIRLSSGSIQIQKIMVYFLQMGYNNFPEIGGNVTMKKVFNGLLILFFIFVWILFFRVLKMDYGNSPQSAGDYRFTFISPFANAGYWGSIAYGMKEADELYHTNTKFIGFMESEPELMSEAIRSAACSAPDGLITAGDSDERVIAALKDAASQGIPIVLIDNDSREIDRLCYIGIDDYGAGRLAGKDMAAAVSGPVCAAVIIGSASNENQRERLRGFEDELALWPGCFVETVMEANYSLLAFREMLPRLLKDNPRINAIFCAEGYSSIIAGEILNAMGPEYDDIQVVVFGKTEEILNHVASGRYYSTIIQESDQIGSLAVKVLRQYQDGIAPEQDTIYIDSISITRENLEGVNIYESEGVIWHLYNGNLLPTPQKEN